MSKHLYYKKSNLGRFRTQDNNLFLIIHKFHKDFIVNKTAYGQIWDIFGNQKQETLIRMVSCGRNLFETIFDFMT